MIARRLTVALFAAFALGCTSPSLESSSTASPAAVDSTGTEQGPRTEAPTEVRGIPTLTELFGNVEPSEDSAFSELPVRMCLREGLFLRTEARDAFVAMHDSALADGIRLTALSATRTFGHQRAIWNRKWARPKYMGWSNVDKARDILLYSSMPGSSRHHWGTDVDIHSLEPSDFIQGDGAQVVAWLRKTAHHFGYAEVYTDDPARSGYQPEAWHWSYVPLAQPFLDALNAAHRRGDVPKFEGFEGADTADSLDVIDKYINGISPSLLTRR
ncbi:MAG: M15 family metallopeptidase [Flavobacteriales bacterium]